MKSPKNTYDVDGIPDRNPIRMHPHRYFLSITDTGDLDCFSRWPLTPVPEIQIDNPDPLDEQQERLQKWRQKRFYEEIYFIMTIWDKGNRCLFRPGFSEEDIEAIRRLKHQAYSDDAHLKYLLKSEDESCYFFAGFSDQEQQEVETEIEKERQDAASEQKPVESKVEEATTSTVSGLNIAEPFFEFDFEREDHPRPPDRPMDTFGIFVWWWVIERHLIWERPSTSDAPKPSILSALEIGIPYDWEKKHADFGIPAFTGLQPSLVNARGQDEVSRGYNWGIPYHALENTARKMRYYTIDRLYERLARHALCAIEMWYLQQSDEAVRQLALGDLREWPLPYDVRTCMDSCLAALERAPTVRRVSNM